MAAPGGLQGTPGGHISDIWLPNRSQNEHISCHISYTAGLLKTMLPYKRELTLRCWGGLQISLCLKLVWELSLFPPFSCLDPLCWQLWAANGAPEAPDGLLSWSQNHQKSSSGLQFLAYLVSVWPLGAHKLRRHLQNGTNLVAKLSQSRPNSNELVGDDDHWAKHCSLNKSKT